jgi:hypothetical protein
MSGFKNEMIGFKDEMLDFKTQAEEDRRQMNRRWGELANKMGTLLEDLVAPSLPRMAKELFGCEEPQLFAVRIKRRIGPKTIELDALVVCADIVLINDTGSNGFCCWHSIPREKRLRACSVASLDGTEIH